MDTHARHENFPVTDWVRLERLQPGDTREKQTVLGELYARYKEPILVFLTRKGCPSEQKEDLVQDFFLYGIEQKLFEKADRARGRFRNLMLSALTHYASKAHRKETAGKRRPAAGWMPMDALQDEEPGMELKGVEDTPEQAFQRAWARSLLDRVVAELKREYTVAGKGTHYEIFFRCIVAPAMMGATAPAYRELGAEFGLAEKEVSNRLITARRAYERLLRAEISSYAKSQEEIDDEIRGLFQTLSKSG